MNTSFQPELAKIYRFPQRGTVTASGHRVGNRTETGLDAQRVAAVAIFTGSWYHEVAVQDADRARKP